MPFGLPPRVLMLVKRSYPVIAPKRTFCNGECADGPSRRQLLVVLLLCCLLVLLRFRRLLLLLLPLRLALPLFAAEHGA